MTETPKPASIKLQPRQWKSIVMNELQMAVNDIGDVMQNLQKANLMDPGGLKWFEARAAEHVKAMDVLLVSLRNYMQGWEISSRPFIAEALKQQQEQQAAQPQTAAPAPQPNGAEPAKKRGGWPKGQKRKAKTSAEVLPPITQ